MNITVHDLLDAGVHFGHQTKRWNPKSKKFIFDHRQGISIIDLEKTFGALEKACEFLTNHVAEGGNVLMIGTKRQAQEIVREAAGTVGMPFSVNRWLGGTLTNYETIKRSIAKFKKYQAMELNGEMAKLPKKEESAIKREMSRMLRNFDGITDMGDLPGAMFVVDINHEEIAVAEGARCNIPVVALVDTNSDPSKVTYPIPGNDDAVKSIRIIVDAVVEAIQAGVAQRESRRASRAADARAAATAAVAAQVAASEEAAAAAAAKAVEAEAAAAAKAAAAAAAADADVDIEEEITGDDDEPKKPAKKPAKKAEEEEVVDDVDAS
jgi:small subunit ribosomal protein S2